MGDVLLACVPADRPRLDALAKAFIDDGHRVGWQQEALWTLPKQVCVVAAWSRNSAGARWLENLARGCARRGRLVSIRLDASQPPRGLKRHRVIDLSMWPAVTADHGVDRLLVLAAEVAERATETPKRDYRFGLMAAVLAAIGLILGLAWWKGGVSPPSAIERHPSPARVAESDVVAAGAATGEPGSGSEPDRVTPLSESAVDAIRVKQDEASFLGELALEQLLDAMAGDADMMDSARGNAERALAGDPTQPAARIALGALLVAMDLDWQQGRQMIGAGHDDGDERLVPLAARLLRMYGEGASTDGVTSDVCDESGRARTRGFIDLAPAERLSLMNNECFLVLTHGDVALRIALGITHE